MKYERIEKYDTLFKGLRDWLIKSKITVDSLREKRHEFEAFAGEIQRMDKDAIPFPKDIFNPMENFLMLCLDYYVYSEDGDVLIPDRQYDMIANIWKERTGRIAMYKADIVVGATSWGYMKHEAPYMVGTIHRKLYNCDELEDYLDNIRVRGYRHLNYAPKFDGVSTSIEFRNGEIISALTRNDGEQGLDITAAIRISNQHKQIFTPDMEDGYYKCELCVSAKDYNDLCKEKKYANRRSATSGILSTPANLELCRFVTIIPLAWTNFGGDKMRYIATAYLADVIDLNPLEFRIEIVYENIERIFKIIKAPSYQFRVDGVVIFPMIGKDDAPNTADLMSHCMAYKFNTQETITQVEGVYMSVGRTGLAKPMVKVAPCDLNETICTDVSIGSMDIFSSLRLRLHEDVMVYSAGDVIPQLRLPDYRKYPKNSPLLKMDCSCPYCGAQLRYRSEHGGHLFCMNQRCPRVISGKIVGFIDKLDLCEGYRDETFITLTEAGVVRDIRDIFTLHTKQAELANLLGPTHAKYLMAGLKEMRETPYDIATVIGSCGIEKIAHKTCERIFKEYPVKYLMTLRPTAIRMKVLSIPKVGITIADNLVDWITENRDLIELFYREMNIIESRIAYGNVVFTGFRSKEYVDKFKKTAFPVTTGGVNGDTVAVVFVGDSKSSNMQKAMQKRVPLVPFVDIDKLLGLLERKTAQIDKYPEEYQYIEDTVTMIKHAMNS